MIELIIGVVVGALIAKTPVGDKISEVGKAISDTIKK